MTLHQKNSKKQGDAGVGMAIGYFSCLGWTVCVPLTDSQDYDLIVDDGNGLKRVQVKTTRHKDGPQYMLNLCVAGGNRSWSGKKKKFDPTRVDLLFALTEDGRMFLIPSDKVKGTTCIRLGPTYSEYLVKMWK